jgi:hypothetical protein
MGAYFGGDATTLEVGMQLAADHHSEPVSNNAVVKHIVDGGC